MPLRMASLYTVYRASQQSSNLAVLHPIHANHELHLLRTQIDDSTIVSPTPIRQTLLLYL